MSIMYIEDNLVLDKGSEALKKQYEQYCSWCWGHGYGDCDICKKVFHKYYIPMRKMELRKKLGLDKCKGSD